MLVTSLGSCLLAFVPLLELLLHLHGSSLWVVASILMFAYCAAYIAYAIPHWRHLSQFHPGALSPRVAIVVWVCSIGPAVLQIMNALSLLFHREPGPYVLGLLLFLIIAGVQFALLV